MNTGFGHRGRGGGNDEAETPGWLYRALDAEFGFTFDAAASEKNHKCAAWTSEIAGAMVNPDPQWRVWCNPPYSNIELFVRLALRSGLFWVLLLPAFVDKTWYRLLWESGLAEWRPFRQRIVFEMYGKPITHTCSSRCRVPCKSAGKPQGPFFGSTLAILRPLFDGRIYPAPSQIRVVTPGLQPRQIEVKR